MQPSTRLSVTISLHFPRTNWIFKRKKYEHFKIFLATGLRGVLHSLLLYSYVLKVFQELKLQECSRDPCTSAWQHSGSWIILCSAGLETEHLGVSRPHWQWPALGGWRWWRWWVHWSGRETPLDSILRFNMRDSSSIQQLNTSTLHSSIRHISTLNSDYPTCINID